MRTWIDVATLAKPKGKSGRLVAKSAAGLPFVLEPGDEVAFVPPQTDAPRRAEVRLVRDVDERTAEVEFEGVDAQAAQMLAGCHCLVKRASLDPSLFEEEPAMWEGWTVVDVRAGVVGAVSGLVDNPGQALLEVDRPDGETVLVPVVDEIVLDADVEASTVHVDLPHGLLDL